MKRWVPWLSLVARFGLAAVLISSGGLKAMDPDQSEIAVRAYHILPESLIYPTSLVLPMFEIALGLLILIGLAVRPTAVVSALLFVVLIGVIASVWARGYKIDCGCFGGGGEDASVTWRHYLTEILRDVGFLVLALWLSVYPRTRWALGLGSRLRAPTDDRSNNVTDEKKELV
ncbi:MauE/DoxX family redox-associated membrane protein [Gordonia sp. CPCC 205333]|uniref:MauE/DoxX family redox-associated membrane protein n=1 Tax=Gordonia sp. CPCC 205333 TaxID=3140790 RepID=UPI003AF34B02